MRSDLIARPLRLAVAFTLFASSLPAASLEDVAVIRTRHGDVAFRFLEASAPQHVGYVRELIQRGFYDGTTFHRVIPNFVIQGGDPNSKDAHRGNDGEGEADRRLKAEFSSTLHYRPGTVGMARDGDPDSGSCQFFIALENLPRLDGRYTIFGEVISGLDVARAIASLPRDLGDNPLERVEMTVRLRKMRVPKTVTSFLAGESGEVLTGPGKPRAWDPGNIRWTAPALLHAERGRMGTESWPAAPVDLSIGEEGSVLDVRFLCPDTRNPLEILTAMKRWKFAPATLDGKPVKARFGFDSHGGSPRPSQAPGTPLEPGGAVSSAAAAVAVPLPPGGQAPEKAPVLRVTLDETGQVTDVSLQVSCGDARLDESAVAEARRMIFLPATRGEDPVPSYLNLRAKFVAAPTP